MAHSFGEALVLRAMDKLSAADLHTLRETIALLNSAAIR
jgi:hypothetical protein